MPGRGTGGISRTVIEHLGRVPDPGETVQLDGARLEVIAADDTQITQLSVLSTPAEGDPER